MSLPSWWKEIRRNYIIHGLCILRAVASWEISFCLFVLFNLVQGQNVKYIGDMRHWRGYFIEEGLSVLFWIKRDWFYFCFMKFIGKLFLKAERKKWQGHHVQVSEVTEVTQSPWSSLSDSTEGHLWVFKVQMLSDRDDQLSRTLGDFCNLIC